MSTSVDVEILKSTDIECTLDSKMIAEAIRYMILSENKVDFSKTISVRLKSIWNIDLEYIARNETEGKNK